LQLEPYSDVWHKKFAGPLHFPAPILLPAKPENAAGFGREASQPQIQTGSGKTGFQIFLFYRLRARLQFGLLNIVPLLSIPNSREYQVYHLHHAIAGLASLLFVVHISEAFRWCLHSSILLPYRHFGSWLGVMPASDDSRGDRLRSTVYTGGF
jgi:hypothetical protein